jgi:hypothetical protein
VKEFLARALINFNSFLGEPPPILSEDVALVAMPPEIQPGNIRRVWDQVISHVLLKHRQGRKSVCYGNYYPIYSFK